VVCEEHGIGGSGEHCGDSDAHETAIAGGCFAAWPLEAAVRS
jgi:hypothetical protein